MAIQFADRVRVVTATTGTGTISLGAATTGFQTFAQATTAGQLTSGCTVYYNIQDGIAWECGSGIYTAGSPDTLTRVVSSSSAGGTTTISLSGAAQVCITLTALAQINALLSGGSINNVTIGATTASSGAFTTLSASSTVSGSGFSNYLAAPPTIGGTTPGISWFTTMNTSINAVIGSNTATPLAVCTINGAASCTRYFQFATSGGNRWQCGVDAGGEPGSNVGSNFFISSFTDAGGLIGNAVTINRASGLVTLTSGLSTTTATFSSTLSGSGITSLLSPYALLAAPALTGNPTATTQGGTDNSTRIATTAYVYTKAAFTSWALTWDGGIIVANGTYHYTVFAPYGGTITNCDYSASVGTFTIQVNIAGTAVHWTGSVTTLSASSSTSTIAGASTNTFTAGQAITCVITSQATSPTNSYVSLRITKA